MSLTKPYERAVELKRPLINFNDKTDICLLGVFIFAKTPKNLILSYMLSELSIVKA